MHEVRWEETRPAMSRRRFVILYGVLGWGLGVGALWSLLFSFTTSAPWWTYTSPALIGFPAAGALWGLIMWRFFGRRRR